MRPVLASTLAVLLAAAVAAGTCHCSVQQTSTIESDGSPSRLNPASLTADEDEVKNLPGLEDAVNFRHFSGYLQADEKVKPKKFLHYWFVESESNPATDPIVLWLNGGPGCSSLGGMFTELGPFQVNDDGKTLARNEFAWNKVANVLFLESPAGVGFSYSNDLIDVHTDDSTARENHLALRNFMKKFPQYKSNPLYLSGESYAGVYLPTLGVLVDMDPELNLKGIAIGNGYLDVGKLTDSLILFSYHHGLVGRTLWQDVSRHCCAGEPPSREMCKFSGSQSSFQCQMTVSRVLGVLNQPGLNPYNLYGKCAGSQQRRHLKKGSTPQAPRLTRETVDKALRDIVALNGSSTKSSSSSSSFFDASRPFHVFDLRGAEKLTVEPPCVDDTNLIKYLNNHDVRTAIHIPRGIGSWSTCSALVYVMKYPKLPGGLAPQMRSLIGSSRNLTMLVYNGDVDTVCNFLGDEWFVDELGRKVLHNYQPWRVDKQIAGYVKHHDGITFATVRGSGHMVPGDRPKEALAMIKLFLQAKGRNVEL